MSERWIPHKYQKKAVRWLVTHPEAALFLDPGLGKTSITLAAFQAMQKAGGCRKALVVAPLRPCYLVWSKEGEGELAKWKEFGDLSVSLLHGTKKCERLEEDADLYVINFEGLAWLVENGRLNNLIKRGVSTLIIDELSRFKHTRTKRFKLFKPYLIKFQRRWGLTGSPAANGLLDLFGQAYTLDLGRALGRYITHYRHKYFLPTGFGGYTWKIQKGADKAIYRELKNLALSMRATDHLDLPELVEKEIWVALPPKARKTYDSMEEDLIASIESNIVTAANAAVASGKCRQIASGGLYLVDEKDPRKRKTLCVHNAKTEALVDLIDELQGSPVLIAYEFQHDLERIRAALGKGTPAINGKSTPKQAIDLITKWNHGELPVLCGHPAAMSHGLNLQAGNGRHVCWYSLTWDLEMYEQLIRRIWRQGNKANRVIVHRILARHTVDSVVLQTLRSKHRGQNALLTALRAYCKMRG